MTSEITVRVEDKEGNTENKVPAEEEIEEAEETASDEVNESGEATETVVEDSAAEDSSSEE